MSGATNDGPDGGASTSEGVAPIAAKRRKREPKEEDSDAESVVEVENIPLPNAENDDEDGEDSDARGENYSEILVETFRAHYDIKIRSFCQAINEKVRCN